MTSYSTGHKTNTHHPNETGISVLVCCHNSESRLPATIKHLALQQVPVHVNWEVIIIDNNSTDNTAIMALQEWNKQGVTNVNFKVIAETNPGKNHALHSGILQAAFSYILICDDDNWLADNYLSKSFEVMQSNPKIGAAGGRGIAVPENELPEWFDKYQHGYAVGEQSSRSGYISSKKYLWGAGMIFRKSLYLDSYSSFPSFLTGPNADTLARGEDVEFCMRILLSGYQLYYDETLVYQHYLPANRLTVNYREKLFEGYSYEKRILDLYAKQVQINHQSLLKNSSLLLSSFVRYIISKVTSKSRWSYQHEAEIIYLIMGHQLTKVSTEILKIKRLQSDLSSKKRFANT